MNFRLKLGDTLLVLLVVAIAAMLITPLPTALIDLLIVLNISFSILLLLVGLYIPNSLGLLSFPTILLLSTLFRLGLNVACTRLVLSQGDAGRVIEAFGTFLIRGELVVGIIVFLIVTIVNFVVIARGASRVSEVAARFILDALPGKQQAIDSDMRAGLVSAEEARRKREDLRRESQLYGSMDGAMKFVQGDAVAGLFIIFANIIGGIYLGVSRGTSLEDAVQTYTVLTIGEGLVSQIPSLLTSICAGIIVTRVSATESSTLGADLGTQLFSRPTMLIFTGVIILVLATLAGLPIVPFSAVALFAIGAGYFMARRSMAAGSAKIIPEEFQLTGPLLGSATVRDERDPGLVTLSLDSGVLFKSYRMGISRYREWWQEFRKGFEQESGLLLPDLAIAADPMMAPYSYSASYKGTVIAEGVLVADSVLIEMDPISALFLGFEVLENTLHPISKQRVIWAASTPSLKRVAEAGNIGTYDFFEFIGLRIANFFLERPEEILSSTDIFSSLRQLEKKHPGLIGEGFGREFLSLPKLTEVLHALAKNGVSLHDFRGIVEAIAAYCSSSGVSVSEEGALDVSDVVTFVRATKRRQISSRWSGSGDILRTIIPSAEIDEIFDGVLFDGRAGALPLEPEVSKALITGLQKILIPVRESGVVPVVIICRSDLRGKISAFLSNFCSAFSGFTGLVTFEELDPGIATERIAIWNVTA